MALYLGEEIVNNAFGDLNRFSVENRKGSSNLDQPTMVVQSRVPGKSKKRKHGSGAPKELPIVVDLGEESVDRTLAVPLSVQIAALETLETLVTVVSMNIRFRWTFPCIWANYSCEDCSNLVSSYSSRSNEIILHSKTVRILFRGVIFFLWIVATNSLMHIQEPWMFYFLMLLCFFSVCNFAFDWSLFFSTVCARNYDSFLG